MKLVANGGGLGLSATGDVWIGSLVHAQSGLIVPTTLQVGSQNREQNQWVLDGTTMTYYNASKEAKFSITSAGAISGGSLAVTGSASFAGFSSSANSSVAATLTVTKLTVTGTTTGVHAVFAS